MSFFCFHHWSRWSSLESKHFHDGDDEPFEHYTVEQRTCYKCHGYEYRNRKDLKGDDDAGTTSKG